jgi:hypothetical protein
MALPEVDSIRPLILDDVPVIAAILLADALLSTGRSD